jgi:hypothetical protein
MSKNEEKLVKLREKERTTRSALNNAESELTTALEAVSAEAVAAILEEREPEKIPGKKVISLRDRVTDLQPNHAAIVEAITKLEHQITAERDDVIFAQLKALESRIKPVMDKFEKALADLLPLSKQLIAMTSDPAVSSLIGNAGVFLFPPKEPQNALVDYEVRCLKGRILGNANELENNWQYREGKR